MLKSSWLPSSVLIFGQTSVHALIRPPLTVQVEFLLEDGRPADAEELLDKATISGIQPEIQQYLHQCIAFKLMGRTQFQKSTRHFVEGAIDPRLLLSYFEELRPALYEKTSCSTSLSEDKLRVNAQDDYLEVEIYTGIDQHRPSETSVDDIIATNLVRNYSPHLRPQTHLETYDSTGAVASSDSSSPVSGTCTHPATIAMRDALRNEANEMIKSVLSAILAEQVNPGTREVVEITSTALALCHAHSGDIPSLLASFAPLQSRSTARTTSRPPSRSASRPSSSSYVHPPPSEISKGASSHPSRPPSSSPCPPTVTIRPHVLAPVLAKLGLWGPLIELWRAVGDVRKLISVLAGLVEETYHDPTVPDPLGQIYAILSALQQPERPMVGTGITVSTISETEKQSLIRKWGPWFAIRDVERGLALLTSTPTRIRSSTAVGSRTKEKEQEKADEFAVLGELRKARVEAAKRYLEWLIVVKGREVCLDPSLRAELVHDCIDDLFKYLEDEAVVKLWRAKAASYASSPTNPVPSTLLPTTPSPHATHPTSSPSLTNAIPLRPPFLSYFASTTPDSPSKRARIKALLILQATIYRGSESVAVATHVQERLTQGGWEKVLGLEMAVLHSKLSPPSVVLRALHALRDNATAETYASSGGTYGVISARIASSAAEGCGLGEWAKWFAKAMEDRGPVSKGLNGFNSEKLESTGGSAEMLKTLVQVYSEEGDIHQVSRLLSSQAESLDVVDIIPLVPASWPLHSVSSFLIRSLRRPLHAKHEGQIVKAISAGQNLDFLEQSYVIIRDEGAIIEEAVEDDEGGGSAEDFDEKSSLVEKVAMQLGQGDVHVADLDTRNGG
ncbi:hypothetical protein SCLCIDRAFT_100585 [Scleroderma citrinum Foug A]|uniref:Uncharacterized protein n=1 Tax=Scleroderma citrinum Foug A TaxID=1036808 RepID=A0A0C3ESH0_9AGAM|nr:hypothetical protein SCLCIDRAFT_100585 [Scleroderma citrinum Foug A]